MSNETFQIQGRPHFTSNAVCCRSRLRFWPHHIGFQWKHWLCSPFLHIEKAYRCLCQHWGHDIPCLLEHWLPLHTFLTVSSNLLVLHQGHCSIEDSLRDWEVFPGQSTRLKSRGRCKMQAAQIDTVINDSAPTWLLRLTPHHGIYYVHYKLHPELVLNFFFTELICFPVIKCESAMPLQLTFGY